MGQEMSHDELVLMEKIRSLPPDKTAEIEDFVDFLARREEDRQLTRAAMRLSQDVLHRVWDNPEDAAYDEL
jgi:hypothetical protein